MGGNTAYHHVDPGWANGSSGAPVLWKDIQLVVILAFMVASSFVVSGLIRESYKQSTRSELWMLNDSSASTVIAFITVVVVVAVLTCASCVSGTCNCMADTCVHRHRNSFACCHRISMLIIVLVSWVKLLLGQLFLYQPILLDAQVIWASVLVTMAVFRCACKKCSTLAAACTAWPLAVGIITALALFFDTTSSSTGSPSQAPPPASYDSGVFDGVAPRLAKSTDTSGASLDDLWMRDEVVVSLVRSVPTALIFFLWVRLESAKWIKISGSEATLDSSVGTPSTIRSIIVHSLPSLTSLALVLSAVNILFELVRTSTK